METHNENAPEKELINAADLDAKVKTKSSSSRSVSREERKKEAGKPLYLTRYE